MTEGPRDPAPDGGALLDLGGYPVWFAQLPPGEPMAAPHCPIVGGTGGTASVTERPRPSPSGNRMADMAFRMADLPPTLRCHD
jgi:hypothetical protein